MKVRLSTVRFDGAGHLDCRKCQRRTTFPDGAWLIVYDYGTIQIVRSVHTLSVLHRCGQEFYWQCEDCGMEPDFDPIMRRAYGPGRRQRLFGCACGGSFKQHRLETVPTEPEPYSLPTTPF